jgi:hypothetical protein
MQMPSVINRSTIKLAVALAVPGLITWLFIYAQQMANQEVKEYKVEQKNDPSADRVTLDNYVLKEVDDQNKVRWQLVSKKGSMDPTTQEVTLDEVKVRYYKGDDVSMTLDAPAGIANEGTRYIRLNGTKNRKVIAEGEGGKAKLTANVVELTKKNQFKATGGVNIEWPKVAKVSGDEAEGDINITNLSNFKISGNTHALIGMH